jgi:hypothetical protein
VNRFFRVVFASVFVSSISAIAAPTYLGLYIKNQKIGYASYSTHPTQREGRSVMQSDTHTVMDAGLLGTPLQIVIDSTSYLEKDNSPLEMDFDMSSSGRTQKVRAHFAKDNVLVSVDNSGATRTLTLKRPDGPIVDDPMNLFLTHQKATQCYILDPTTVSFVPNEVRLIGTKTVSLHGRLVKETIVDLIDPRATTRAYLDPEKNLIRAVGPMGITMIPVSKSVAIAKPSAYSATVDLGYSTSIVPTGTIENPAATTEIKLRLSGKNLEHAPNDASQTLSGSGDVWTLDVHPPRFEDGVSISKAGQEKPEYIRDDLDIPSNSLEFKRLAKKIVGERTETLAAALAIKDWVYSQMKPNAGIGVLRDASEVLRTKEGVCRDYAILTATLLKSAGIPTRLASGLVSWDGTFYYHAWDEVWDGSHWIGIDSTTPDKQISAAHIKLAEGSVAEAFNFVVLDHVSIKILSSQD